MMDATTRAALIMLATPIAGLCLIGLIKMLEG